MAKIQFPALSDPNNLDEVVILKGGRDWPVQLKDGTETTVFLHKQPFLEMEVLLKVWGQFKGELLCYTKKDEAYLATLTDQSLAAALKEGRALNFLLFSEYCALNEQTLSAYGKNIQNLSTELASAVAREAASK